MRPTYFIVTTFLTLIFGLNAQNHVDYELLNGTWLQACDSIVKGKYAGEIECSIELNTRVSFEIKRNKGIMVRNDMIANEIDSSQVMIKIIGSDDYLIGSKNDKPWIRKIHKIKIDSLGIYSEGGEHITIFLR